MPGDDHNWHPAARFREAECDQLVGLGDAEVIGGEVVDAKLVRPPCLRKRRGELTTIMMCGLQGAGKTTTCGKLALLVKEKKLKPFLIAADLQRPAAIEQLHVLVLAPMGLSVSRPAT